MRIEKPGEGRLLSEELGDRLYGALRERILRDRMASRKYQVEESTSSQDSASEPDSQNATYTLEDVTKKLKEQINHLAYMKRVKRGMLLHREYMRENELMDHSEDETYAGNDTVDIVNVRPLKRRKRAKSRALTARKGARRVGQSIRRRPTYSPGHSFANRLRRRSLPNKGYFRPRKHITQFTVSEESCSSFLRLLLRRLYNRHLEDFSLFLMWIEDVLKL